MSLTGALDRKHLDPPPQTTEMIPNPQTVPKATPTTTVEGDTAAKPTGPQSQSQPQGKASISPPSTTPPMGTSSLIGNFKAVRPKRKMKRERRKSQQSEVGDLGRQEVGDVGAKVSFDAVIENRGNETAGWFTDTFILVAAFIITASIPMFYLLLSKRPLRRPPRPVSSSAFPNHTALRWNRTCCLLISSALPLHPLVNKKTRRRPLHPIQARSSPLPT